MDSLTFHITRSLLCPKGNYRHSPKLVTSNVFTASKFHGSRLNIFGRNRPFGNGILYSVSTRSSLKTHSSQEEKDYGEAGGGGGGGCGGGQLEELRVPDHWLLPSKALEESEWLRVTLHKWLDDEYCPEETNVEISKVAASSYYKSLLDKQRDLGEILLKMARELESISYQDSFHGAFSSANAAIDLISQRIEQE